MKDELKQFIRKKFITYADAKESSDYPGLWTYTITEGNTASDLDDFIDDLISDMGLIIKIGKMFEVEFYEKYPNHR